jgi:hypothetical protein
MNNFSALAAMTDNELLLLVDYHEKTGQLVDIINEIEWEILAREETADAGVV